MTAHVHHHHQRRPDRERRHRRADKDAAADGEHQEECPREFSQITIHVDSRDKDYRLLTGISNFSAVCVSEKRATLTSTRPTALPADMTSFSEIFGLPFGRITQMAPSRLRKFCSVARRWRSRRSLAATKMTSTGSMTRATTVAPRVSISSRSVASRMPTNSTTCPGLTPSLSMRLGGLRMRSAHFTADEPSSNEATPLSHATTSTPSLTSMLDTDLYGIVSRRSSPRNTNSSVSSSALPTVFFPLIVTVHFASAPISERTARRWSSRRGHDHPAP